MRALALLVAALTLSACTTAGAPYTGAPDDRYDEVVVTGAAEGVTLERAGRATAPDRQFVRDATLAVDVEDEGDVPTALERAEAITESLDGYVSFVGPAEAVLRIPDARLDEALDRLAALGEVERREVRVADVTAAYTDLQIRLDNALALRARLRALLADAAGVQDVLAVERELARVTTEVERLEGQLRLLQNQVAFSTVRLSVGRDVDPGPLGWVFVGLLEGVRWLFVWD
jgi:hypothetical protein